MNDYNRQRLDLIAGLTDEGQVWPLDLLVGKYGPKLATRGIADGVAVICRDSYESLEDSSFLSIEDAIVIINRSYEMSDYVIAAGPSTPIALEDEPNLIFGYGSDKPDAVAEVRRHNAERREPWVKCR